MPFLQEYTMLDELGKGGFATVYKVRHNELGYIRAVRVLNETIVDANSPTYQKFLRECKVLLRLGNGNHPNIVHIYQPRLLDNKALVEMDYVDGQDIMHYLKQKKNFVPVEEVIRMALQMSSALAYCHEDIYRFCMDRDLDNLQDDPNDGSKVLLDDKTRQHLIAKYKVIHNDIHSGNIMRREDGNFVLLDFGLAINGDEVVRSSRHANGAPEFKSPEKWDDDSVLSEQSDIYSFGVVMFQYLAGRVPFPYNTKISSHKAEYELGEAHQKATPPSIEMLRKESFEVKHKGEEYTKDYPQWLEDVILKCLQKKPNDRFKNGKELYEYISAQIEKKSSVQYVTPKLEDSGLSSHTDQEAVSESRIVQPPEIICHDQKQKISSNNRKSRFWLLIGTILIVAVAGCFLWIKNEKADTQSHSGSNVVIGQVGDTSQGIGNKEDTVSAEDISSDNKGLTDVNDKVVELIKQFAEEEANDDIEAISLFYADIVQRYFNQYNVSKSKIVENYRKYNETFGVYGKHIDIRWNTMQVQSLQGNEVSVIYVEDFSIDRVDKTKKSKFVIEKHLLFNKDYKIVSVYDVQLSSSK